MSTVVQETKIIYTFIFKCDAAQIKIKFQWKSQYLKITKKSLILCFVIQIESVERGFVILL